MKRILATTLLILAAATFAFGQCSDADKKALEAFDRAWGGANERGDRTFLQNIFADDYVNMSLTGMLNKTQTIDNNVRAAERNRANPQNAERVTHDQYMSTCTPNTATITHRTAVTTKSGGEEQTSYTRAVHFLEKRNGRWQVVSNSGYPLDDAAQLLYMQREWNDASKSRDAAWFERNFADDATFVSYGTGALRTKAEWIANFKDSKTAFDSIEPSDMSVRVEGNTAVVTGILHLKGRDDKGQLLDHRFRFIDAYVKRDGRWQVLAAQGTRVQ